MSEENVDIIRRAYEAYAQGDLVAMVEDVDPKVITYTSVDGATYHGPDGLIQAVAVWVEGFDNWTMTPEEFIDANDHQVIVPCSSIRGRGAKRRSDCGGLLVRSHAERRKDHPNRHAGQRARGRPRSRRAGGVGDVGGERRGGAPAVTSDSTTATSMGSVRFCAPDLELRDLPSTGPDSGVFVGHDAARRLVDEDVTTRSKTCSSTRSEFIDAGDRIVVVNHATGRGRGSSAKVEMNFSASGR